MFLTVALCAFMLWFAYKMTEDIVISLLTVLIIVLSNG